MRAELREIQKQQTRMNLRSSSSIRCKSASQLAKLKFLRIKKAIDISLMDSKGRRREAGDGEQDPNGKELS